MFVQLVDVSEPEAAVPAAVMGALDVRLVDAAVTRVSEYV